jgi:glutamine synthetase
MTTQATFLATCDLGAKVRGRAIANATGDKELFCGWVPADQAINAFDVLATPNNFGSMGDLRMHADKNSKVTLPGRNGGAAMDLYLSDLLNMDGTPWECDPRAALKVAILELKKKHDLDITASFEHEFILTHADGSKLAGVAFGLDSMRSAEPFGTELIKLLTENGLEPENWLAEFGAGQFEITLKPAPALVACDRAILLREIVHDLARCHGLKATFVPLPHPDSVGNGVHVHLSFSNSAGPCTYDPAGDGGLSEIASRAAAGIVANAEMIMAISAPSQISYLRLKPHRWSSGAIFVGLHTREALLRICPLPADADPVTKYNLEYRAADATANPWFVMAALIRSATAGLDAGNPVKCVVKTEVDELSQVEWEQAGIRSLPTSLDEALAHLAAGTKSRDWFSDLLLDTHLVIRAAEKTQFENTDDVTKCAKYADVY